MDRIFENRVALVTGAAGGLGRAVAVMLAQRGADIALTDRPATQLDESVKAVGGSVLAMEAELADGQTCSDLVARTLERFGRLDILVNVAGDYTGAAVEDLSAEIWQAMFDANLVSTFNMMKSAVPTMQKQGSGGIINISSVDAHLPKPGMVHYSASKAGVNSLTRSFAAAYGPDGIRVNGVAPGPIATERAKRAGFLEKERAGTVLDRVAEPEDIAEIVSFLASDASRSITGETIVAGCGYGMR
jgi:NAD(P)-dependent dehydrogenase (short-subunit alcohol dehydrogenase family)